MSSFTETPSRTRTLQQRLRQCAGTFLLTLSALSLSGGAVMAQEGGGKLPAADETALRTYVLRPETVERALAVAQEARREKIPGQVGKGVRSLDAWAAGLSANAKAKALLDKHQIPARDYVMTMIALMRANYAVNADVKKPEEAGSNADNIAYFKSNKDHVLTGLRGGSGNAGDANAGKAAPPEKAK